MGYELRSAIKEYKTSSGSKIWLGLIYDYPSMTFEEVVERSKKEFGGKFTLVEVITTNSPDDKRVYGYKHPVECNAGCIENDWEFFIADAKYFSEDERKYYGLEEKA